MGYVILMLISDVWLCRLFISFIVIEFLIIFYCSHTETDAGDA